jgi:hypothetical protein
VSSAAKAEASKNEFCPDKAAAAGYIPTMSFADVLQELPGLTVEQRQILIRRALEMDDPPLTPEDEALVDVRLAALREDPASGVPLGEMKSRLRSRFSK